MEKNFERGVKKDAKWALDKDFRRNVLWGDVKSGSSETERDLRIIQARAKKNNQPNRTVTRSAHNYEWFGIDIFNAIESIEKFRVAALCLSLEDLKFKCYAPDPEYDDCCICFTTTEEDLEVAVKKNPQLRDFLAQSGTSLVEFSLTEITDKIFYSSNFFDIIELMGLGEEESEAIPIEEVIEEITEEMNKDL
jgi:hypothetical protein